MSQQDESAGSLDHEQVELFRQKRKGCIVKLIGVWLAMGLVAVLTMVYIRTINVDRDPESIRAAFEQDYRATFPEDFYPYSRNRDPAQWQLLKALKAELDPKSQVNPGALGLPEES